MTDWVCPMCGHQWADEERRMKCSLCESIICEACAVMTPSGDYCEECSSIAEEQTS